MFSVGIDMVEIKRIKKSCSNPRFLNKILGNQEYEQLKERNFPLQSIAANFCAKEAFSKALGTGIRNFSLCDVEILRNELGEPYIILNGKAKDIAKINNLEFRVSITHTKEYACAVVIYKRSEFHEYKQ